MGYELDFGALLDYLSLFAEGTAVTLGLAAVAALCGIPLAIAGAALAWGRPGWSRQLVQSYVELIRNTPFIVQLFFIFFGLPGLGFRLGAYYAAALALTINFAAYAAEIVRAGLESVPTGQREAGRALGLGPILIFALIALPQAVSAVYPALTSQIVITMLESAVVSQIAVVDLTHAGDFVQSRNFRSFETYLVVTVIYLGLAILVRRLLMACRRAFARGIAS